MSLQEALALARRITDAMHDAACPHTQLALELLRFEKELRLSIEERIQANACPDCQLIHLPPAA